MKKKLLALLMSAVMVITLGGCSNEPRDDGDDDETESHVSSKVKKVYDGIDWDNIPEAPASDFGYCICLSEKLEDPDYIVGYTGDGSELIKSIFIFDYYGNDKNVKIPKEIDGLPVIRMGSMYGYGYYKEPWKGFMGSEWVDAEWDSSVFRGTDVENVFIPEHIRGICYRAFDDCSTLKSISVDPNNFRYFSENGVLFMDTAVRGGRDIYDTKLLVYTKLPKYTHQLMSDGYSITDGEIIDPGETVEKTPECLFSGYIDSSVKKSGVLPSTNTYNIIQFTDGTYGTPDRVTGDIIPIKKDQFKLESMPYLIKYPEGKSDKSYTIKKRDWIIGYDEDGSKEVKEGFAAVCDPAANISFAFNNVRHLKELNFENGVTEAVCSIRNYPESEIPIGIEKITIPESLVYIKENPYGVSEEIFGAFSDLTNLKEYSVDEKNTVFKSVDGALLSKDGKTLYSVPGKIGGSYTVPGSVEIIADSAFSNAHNMTVTIPGTVKYLGYGRGNVETYGVRPGQIIYNCSDITLNVSSRSEHSDSFEGIPDFCEARGTGTNITVNFTD